MIKDALTFLSNVLNKIENVPGGSVAVDNVARLDDPDFSNKTKVLLSLINIEEEKTLKNDPFYIRKTDPQKGEQLEKRNPTLYVNLYVLISCADEYQTALERLGNIVEYLQGRNVFTAGDSEPDEQYPVKAEKIILDLFSLNFEQINHLWGILGGKYVPSVLYKMRLLPIQYGRTEKVGRVEEISATSNGSN